MESKMTLQIFRSFQEEAERDAMEDKMMSPEECLDLVELLRLEAGNWCMNTQPDFKEFLRVLEKKYC
jgi:hypothetical protein